MKGFMSSAGWRYFAAVRNGVVALVACAVAAWTSPGADGTFGNEAVTLRFDGAGRIASLRENATGRELTGFAECCVALFVLGLCQGVYEAAHYPAMFDCVSPRYRSVTTGLTGCMAFMLGSFSPLIIGWMSEHMSLRTGLASIGVFYLAGALLLVPAQLWFFKRDWIGNSKEETR